MRDSHGLKETCHRDEVPPCESRRFCRPHPPYIERTEQTGLTRRATLAQVLHLFCPKHVSRSDHNCSVWKRNKLDQVLPVPTKPKVETEWITLQDRRGKGKLRP